MKGLRILLDLINEARLAVAANRGRSALSILGIAVGIAAVMTVDAVTTGGRVFIMKELETFGLRSVWVYRRSDEKDPHKRTRAGSGIDSNDLKALEANCCPGIRRLSPIVLPKRTTIVQVGNNYSDAEIQGVNADFLRINSDHLRAGRGLRPSEVRGRRPVAIIGEKVAESLFPEHASPVGRSIRISGREYRVIGILAYKSRDLLASIGSDGGGDVNNRILLPYTLVQTLNGTNDVSYLQGEAVSLAEAESAVAQLTSVLERRHRGAFQYDRLTLASYLDTVERIFTGVTLMGVVAASTALLVGAIGVAGIMSTAVAERTREIGIRAAVGAHRWHIMTQFVSEAILLSVLGGIGGLIFGLLVAAVLGAVAGVQLLPGAGGILVALCVSVLVGLAAGYLPARRAAEMRPVDALRSD